MLELRTNCALCDKDLPPDADDARICSHECTFCAACVEDGLHDVCPNCGGGFRPRPVRPRRAWPEGTGLENDPAGGRRRQSGFTRDEIHAFVAAIHGIDPADR
jgi:hypothetical protein